MNPPKKVLSNDIIGLELEPVEVEWSDNDTMLYALAVGCTPDEDLDYLYEAKGPKVLPTFGVVPSLENIIRLSETIELDIMNILHGEQSIEMYRAIPPKSKKAVAKGRVENIFDKGASAVISVDCEITDEDGPILKTNSKIFAIGAGGFGGERGPSAKGVNMPPDRKPDHTVSFKTLPQQGALYRLTGDRVPLHIDPEFAVMAGFKAPFMHGLCTYAISARAIINTLCNRNPETFLGFTGRFSDKVWFGDEVLTKIWRLEHGEAIVQAENQEGTIVISQARATFIE